MKYRINNFDFLRLLFATMVIITHSYPLSGLYECDFLCQISHEQLSCSAIGLKGFFIISGYLIFQSLMRSQSILDYFWKRFLRLFPALFVVLLLTVLLLPFVYEGNVPYFQNKAVVSYIPNNLSLYFNQFVIEGVFEKNPYKSTINGSIWTICYEFTMYFLLATLIFFKQKKIVLRVILTLNFLLFLVCNVFYFDQLKDYYYILSGQFFLDFGIFFSAGSLLAVFNIEKMNQKPQILVLFLILFITSVYFDYFAISKYFTLPFIIILFGLIPIPYISNISEKIGDLSYGIYIYAFPIQQTLMYFFKLNHLELMFFSIFIAYIFGFLSWHLIEKKALLYKNCTLKTNT